MRATRLCWFCARPRFPTGGVIVEPQRKYREAYRTGRGSFRLRCEWEVEDLGRGQWQIVDHRNPVSGAEIQADRKDGRSDPAEKSADSWRCARRIRRRYPHGARAALQNVDPDVLMGMLFRNSDLETRFSLNMNVLIDGLTPKVCSLKEVLRAFLITAAMC